MVEFVEMFGVGKEVDDVRARGRDERTALREIK